MPCNVRFLGEKAPMREITIGKNQGGQRLDKFLAKYMKDAPKNFLYKMLRKKNIKLNGKRAEGNEKLTDGDVVTLYLSEETIEKFTARPAAIRPEAVEAFPLDIIYENEHIALINKPAGVLSQKARADDISLVEQFVQYAGGGAEDGFMPGICNRLDRNTSGIVIAGKTLAGLQKMSELLRDRQLSKYYLAVVKGEMTEKAVISGYLKKNCKTNKVELYPDKVPDSSYIRTGYEPICSDGAYTLLRVRLFTGKTHQIRSHLSSIAHPIAGDAKYGGRVQGSMLKRQLLHAYEIEFPVLSEPFEDLSSRRFRAEIPVDFYKEKFAAKLIERMSER